MNRTYKGKNWRGRLMCLLLAMLLLSPGLSVDAEALSAKYMYTTMSNVMFRPQAGTSDYIDRLPSGWPLELLSEQEVNNEIWYQVKAKSTPTFPNREYTGFVRSNVVRRMTVAEEAAYLAGTGSAATPAPATPAPGGGSALSNIAVVTATSSKILQTPNGQLIAGVLSNTRITVLETPADTTNGWYKVSASGYTGYISAGDIRVLTVDEANNPGGETPQSGYVKLTKHNVNLRRTPGGESLTQVPVNTVLAYHGSPTTRAGYQWVYVMYNGIWGYVRGDCYSFSDASGNPVTGPTSAPSPTPTTGTEAPVPGTTGSIRLTKGGVNLRRTPGGESLMQMVRGLTLVYSGQPVMHGGYQWVYAQHPQTGTWGYVRGDCYEFVTGTTPTPTTPPTGSIGYIVTTVGSLNVRTAPSMNATTFTQLPNAGVTFPYKGLVTGGGRQWYHITYNNRSAYILSTYANVTTAVPTTAPGATPAPTANPADLSSTAVTTMDRVLVRAAGNSSARTLTILYQKGSVARLTGQTADNNGYIWRHVTAGGVTGWIRGDLLRILTKTEEAQLGNTGNPDLPQEATYRTLRRGDTGTDVTRLQTELASLGFLPASAVTGRYTTDTADAVRQYQRAAGLSVDGIAGPLTQHRMYGTVPVGTNNPGGTVDPMMYPVEKENWTVVNNTWQRGVTAVLTDVKTGLSFRAKRWAGGAHADVEPLTAADTAVMCRIYGVSNAQQIADKNLWDRRPFWVTVAGHSFAASVYGIPHNYPAGDTIANNDFNGQFCVHFVGSTTHTSPNTPDSEHQKAIQEAYDKAPSKK